MKSFLPCFLAVMMLTIFCVAGVSAAAEEPQTLSSSVVLSVSEEIDASLPDRETAEAFLWSPTFDLVTACLTEKENPGSVPNETGSILLRDFPYSPADDELVVRDITVSELLSGMNITITAYGWLTSVDTHAYLEYAVGDSARKADLKNAYYFIQAMAKRGGYEKTIPVRFVNISLTAVVEPDPWFMDNGSLNGSSAAETAVPVPTQTSVPLAGLFAGVGVAAGSAGIRRDRE